MSAWSVEEIERLLLEVNPPWDGKRPPYGETDPRFDVEAARRVLENLEREPVLTQGDSDTLFVELRMACEYVERIQPLLKAAPALLSILKIARAWQATRERVKETRLLLDDPARMESVVAALSTNLEQASKELDDALREVER